MNGNKIEVYKDMGNYVLCKTVESRDNQIFIKMKKVTRREYDFG